MKKSLNALAIAAVLGFAAMTLASDAAAWWGGPGGNGNGSMSFNMGSWLLLFPPPDASEASAPC
ncbi:MAG: hypothetical protein HQL63_07185, partial [Magnetococcales bacterium]|nr:hypothetical protein [Magnetococcales bacterium]